MAFDPGNAEVYSTVVLDCWRGEDGIVYVRSKKAERTIENYLEVFELYGKLSSYGEEKFCLLGDITETKPVTKEVREFVAAQMQYHVRALAMVSTSKLGTATGNVFQVLSGNPYPTALFSDHEKALEWLRKHL